MITSDIISSDTIVALATSPGANGAIAVIRLSGAEAINIANTVFKGKDLSQQATHTLHFGTIRDGEDIVDEVVISLFKGPNSYTKEHVVEISTHNSTYIIERVLSLLIRHGARAAKPGEFTLRAYLNGGLDLSQAEAVADLIASENRASHEIAMNQMRGGISSELQRMREQLINFTALLELELDFGEEDVEFADRSEFLSLIATLKSHVTQLINSFEYGNAIKNGVPVAIIGKPNAGKSTLLNTLLNEERAIVSDIAGTTRDTIEEMMTIDGVTFRFIDTAGLRDTLDTIEAIGVARAKEKVAAAKILLYLYDSESNTAEEVITQIKAFHREGLITILVRNKIDLEGGYSANEFDDQIKAALFPDGYADEIVAISAKDPASVARLTASLVDRIRGMVSDNQQVITNIRHVEALKLAFQSMEDVDHGFQIGLSGDLLASHLRDALRHIGTITGQIDVDRDILGTIFGKFCIGK
ncbi:tRNA uridine-5-carboxymethylaminomethyl(34) synthesis GTPase MnmE [Sphingobacterium sp. lm-10]|uniref:tRNA uridine-5-carboxymethylaminomethyl(34) synthesis GTPase MnmE n=1 Tax=Sphingobacterium sp. lm-10 TaxID=2944904 RepID=UPI002020DDD6|nr:tRNA uridine-5-carboxymethylaminomethyl(34) synthesis GTPase MnmE [Sphingobacterium sp. lm-10]MCL7987344.1 tRNA uridine-5-carboxymethylaminomethyl(34) synthesis GTPase MnmE [Sphingobacterium sp. lm-10]